MTINYHCDAQDSLALEYAHLIQANALKQHVKTLASEEMEGRLTGERGQKEAALYLYRQWKEMGLLSLQCTKDSLDYFQPFLLEHKLASKGELKINGKTFNCMQDFLYEGDSSTAIDSLPVVFLGHDRSMNYKLLNLEGKAALFLSDNLRGAILTADKIQAATKASAVLYANGKRPNQYASLIRFRKLLLAKQRYTLSEKLDLNQQKDSTSNWNRINKIQAISCSVAIDISPEIFQEIMGFPLKKSQKYLSPPHNSSNPIETKPESIYFHIQRQIRQFQSENVMAFIPGRKLKDEVIVVSAHYDHLGRNGKTIYYGANDNASGTAAILELARVFQKANEDGHGPERSILFVAFSGEEKGILGSKYFVENPPFDQEHPLINLNIDMIGRKDDHHKSTDYIYLLGTNHLAPRLHYISDSINALYTNLELDYTYDQPNHFLYKASDQASFVSKGIPAIFYFNGLHDDYHRSSDTWKKIDYKAAANVCQLIFLTTWDLSNRKSFPKSRNHKAQ